MKHDPYIYGRRRKDRRSKFAILEELEYWGCMALSAAATIYVAWMAARNF